MKSWSSRPRRIQGAARPIHAHRGWIHVRVQHHRSKDIRRSERVQGADSSRERRGANPNVHRRKQVRFGERASDSQGGRIGDGQELWQRFLRNERQAEEERGREFLRACSRGQKGPARSQRGWKQWKASQEG